MSQNDFTQALRDFGAQDVPQMVQTAHRKIALEGLTRLVARTPVDTGRARGNWQVGIGASPAGQIEPAELLPPSEKTRDQAPPLAAVGQKTVDAGAQVIATIKPFCVSHITNNVNYIVKLEDGGSRQAPGGMLALTFEELAEMFQ